MHITEVVYYTDPLCCWSWGMETAIKKLQATFDATVRWRYCMCGLIPDWKHFSDPVNSVQRPAQMGPVWMHAQAVSGASFDTTLWFKDPPSSSYPACIAVKCVELQNISYVPSFIELLRTACMTNGINIARTEALVSVGELLTLSVDTFDIELFRQDLIGQRARDAFRKDLEEVRIKQIDRYPSLLVRKADNSQVLFSGYRSYDELSNIFRSEYKDRLTQVPPSPYNT
ncbi:MAG: DsbA family protein [Chitinophagaceae bacterium]|nr:DsbA family protein [Chitinophagaceae bacterium]